jgi:hypothetical protein
MKAAAPFNPEYPYQLSEADYSRLVSVTHMLAFVTDLADGAPGATVTVSREQLATFTGHLAAQLKQV